MIHKEIERYHLVKQIRQRYSLLVKDNLGFPSPPKGLLIDTSWMKYPMLLLRISKVEILFPPFPRSNFKAIVREITEDLPAKLSLLFSILSQMKSVGDIQRSISGLYNKMMGEDLKFEPTSDCMSYLLRLKKNATLSLLRRLNILIREYNQWPKGDLNRSPMRD